MLRRSECSVCYVLHTNTLRRALKPKNLPIEREIIIKKKWKKKKKNTMKKTKQQQQAYKIEDDTASRSTYEYA